MIDPFSQVKREYRKILGDADSSNRINFVPSQSLHDALRETFHKVTNNKNINYYKAEPKPALGAR